VPADPGALHGWLSRGPGSPRNTTLNLIVTNPTPGSLTLWVFWGDSTGPKRIPLAAGAGTFFLPATHRYSTKSFRQHRHKPYTVTAFMLCGSGASQTLLAGSVLVFRYFPRRGASFANS
jgi:hypothetical protein